MMISRRDLLVGTGLLTVRSLTAAEAAAPFSGKKSVWNGYDR